MIFFTIPNALAWLYIGTASMVLPPCCIFLINESSFKLVVQPCGEELTGRQYFFAQG